MTKKTRGKRRATRHTNTTGYQQIRRGRTREDIARIARKLRVPLWKPSDAFPAWVVAEHNRSTEFMQQLAAMAEARTQNVVRLRAEFQRVSDLLRIAQEDLHAILPAMARAILREYDEMLKMVQLAIKCGEDDAAAEGTRFLAHNIRVIERLREKAA